MSEHTRNFGPHARDKGREALRAEVEAEEREAVKLLGGPVVRSHQFAKDGTGDLIFVWRLK